MPRSASMRRSRPPGAEPSQRTCGNRGSLPSQNALNFSCTVARSSPNVRNTTVKSRPGCAASHSIAARNDVTKKNALPLEGSRNCASAASTTGANASVPVSGLANSAMSLRRAALRSEHRAASSTLYGSPGACGGYGKRPSTHCLNETSEGSVTVPGA
eukprot:Amastigsp_a513985_7.p4 type:complete len:158 gc:universal Amastigsp_a513985_7:686-213(-)